MKDDPAPIFWLTGLSGAGKTTIGRCLLELLRNQAVPAVQLDGDDLRPILGADGDHTIETRIRLGLQYAQLSQLLARQGVAVVWTSVSMFEPVYMWCEENLSNFMQVYVHTPFEVVKRRDTKGLYGKASNGEIADVVGVNIEIVEPPNPHLVLSSDGSVAPDALAQEIWNSHRHGFWQFS